MSLEGVPERIGAYTVLRRLGSGGMGVVHLGRSASGRLVAIKVIHAQYCEDRQFRERFRREVAAARRVSGAFTASVVSADPEAESPWMATTYVKGPTLSALVHEQGPLGERELTPLAYGLLEALEAVHAAGIVHRDLKPSNVLMSQEGPRVIDFGVSRASDDYTLTHTGAFVGTVSFASPEALSGKSVTPASDVFSMGAVLGFAATGAGPFDAGDVLPTIVRVFTTDPELDGTPAPLRAIVERCLAKEPGDRPGLPELRRLLDALPPHEAAAPAPVAGSGADVGTGAAVGTPVQAATAPAPGPGTVRDAPAPAVSGLETVTAAPRPAATPPRADTPAAPAGSAGRRPRRTAVRLGLFAGGGALAVTATVFAVAHHGGNTPRAGAASGPSVSAAPAAAAPEGWAPWQTALAPVATHDRTSGAKAGAANCLSAGTTLYCTGAGWDPVRVNGLTGKVDWKADTGDVPDDGVSLAGLSGHHLIGWIDGDVTDPAASTLADFDTATGRMLWSKPLNREASPAMLGSTVVPVTQPDDGVFRGYAASTGRQLWTWSAPEGSRCTMDAAAAAFYAQCRSYEQAPTEIIAVDPRTGTGRRLGAVREPVYYLIGSVGHELVYDVSRSHGIVRMDERTGKQHRATLDASLKPQELGIQGGHLYADDGDHTISFLDPDDGSVLRSVTTDVHGIAGTAVSAATHTFYVGDTAGRVDAIDLGTLRVRWRQGPRTTLQDGILDGDFTALAPLGAVLVGLTPDGTAFSVRP